MSSIETDPFFDDQLRRMATGRVQKAIPDRFDPTPGDGHVLLNDQAMIEEYGDGKQQPKPWVDETFGGD